LNSNKQYYTFNISNILIIGQMNGTMTNLKKINNEDMESQFKYIELNTGVIRILINCLIVVIKFL